MGPWRALAPALAAQRPVRIVLDRYPNVDALAALRDATGGAIDFCAEPVDATRVPPALTGVRTI